MIELRGGARFDPECAGCQKIVGGGIMRQQRLNLASHLAVLAAGLRDVSGAIGRRAVQCGLTDPPDLGVSVRRHDLLVLPNTRSSHNFANRQSRLTVSTDTFI